MTDKNSAQIKQHRRHPRYSVPWKIVVVYKKSGKQESHHGKVCDLSLGGATILTDHNIHSVGHVVVTIEIPSRDHNPRGIIVGAKCHILHSIISSSYGQYRTGIGFIEFNGKGKVVLMEALSRLVEINDRNTKLYVLPPF